MRAVAFLWARNEQDIIGHVVHHLNTQGVEAHVIDDYSTDGTAEIAESEGATIIPWLGPKDVASWRMMMEQTAVIALAYAIKDGHFWAIHHDADEIRRSPVPNETLLDFFTRARMAGWNAVDHHVQVFAPRDGYDPEIHHPETYFTEPFWSHMDSKNGQIKAWWQTPDLKVDLASSGGHKVKFEGRLVCPERLILRHYPMRGAEQRAAKARDRSARWNRSEIAKGWHVAAYNSS